MASHDPEDRHTTCVLAQRREAEAAHRRPRTGGVLAAVGASHAPDSRCLIFSYFLACIVLLSFARASFAAAPETPAPVAPTGENAPAAPAALGATQAAKATPAAPADTAAESFINRCSGCHTVGGGALKGPDLLPSTQWPRETLRQAVVKMEKNVGAMKPEDVDALVTLMHAADLRPRLDAARAAAALAMQATLAPPSAVAGEALFMGATGLTGGGPACAACHAVAGVGGGLGPDLTNLASKMDHVAMVSAFQGANFLVMRATYAGRPVTAQEAAHLAAFVTKNKSDASPPAGPGRVVALAGTAGGLLIFGALAALLRPKRGTRRSLLSQSARN
jgi:ubiquinol-cytochrome c reductase cytochrome c subunit